MKAKPEETKKGDTVSNKTEEPKPEIPKLIKRDEKQDDEEMDEEPEQEVEESSSDEEQPKRKIARKAKKEKRRQGTLPSGKIANFKKRVERAFELFDDDEITYLHFEIANRHDRVTIRNPGYHQVSGTTYYQ